MKLINNALIVATTLFGKVFQDRINFKLINDKNFFCQRSLKLSTKDFFIINNNL